MVILTGGRDNKDGGISIMKLKNTIYFLVLSMLIVNGCATSLKPEQRSVLLDNKEKIDNKVREKYSKKTTEIKKLTSKSYEKNRAPYEIEFYYKDCQGFISYQKSMNAHLYQIKSPNNIDKRIKYIKIARVIIPKLDKDDESALNEMAEIASNSGGDAVIDVYREPICGGIHVDDYVNDPCANLFGPAPKSYYRRQVIAFEYKGLVIRYSEDKNKKTMQTELQWIRDEERKSLMKGGRRGKI